MTKCEKVPDGEICFEGIANVLKNKLNWQLWKNRHSLRAFSLTRENQCDEQGS